MVETSIRLDPSLPKNQFYPALTNHIAALLEGEKNLIARMATVAALLGEIKKYLWAGFYVVEGNELIVGPYSGPLACLRIKKGRGVCGTAWAKEKSLLVPNVHEFADHIACSSLSNSEIVIPIRDPKDKKIIAVFDVDHVGIGGLDEQDLTGFENLIESLFSR